MSSRSAFDIRNQALQPVQLMELGHCQILHKLGVSALIGALEDRSSTSAANRQRPKSRLSPTRLWCHGVQTTMALHAPFDRGVEYLLQHYYRQRV